MNFKILNSSNAGFKKNIRDFAVINLGILLVAAGIVLFKTPNRFALGGVSGISLLLTRFFPSLPIGSMMLGLNIFLLILGYLFLGKDVATKSFYGSFALSGMVWLLELFIHIDSPLTGQTFMELIYGVFLPGIGGAIVFSLGATTGGTDILAKILSKHFKMKISLTLLVSDFGIALCSGLVFGVQACLFSVMGVCLKAFVTDNVLESLQIYKIVVVVSSKSEEVKDYICNKIKRGATVHKATGAFTIAEKEVITTVLSRRQATDLQAFIKHIDPDAFITISNSSRIIGHGFGRFE